MKLQIILTIACLFAFLLWPSTAQAQLFRFGKKKDPLPVVFNRVPSQAELLRHLASQNNKFKQLSSDLRISLDGAPKLRGTMQMELPKRLRIKAGVLGSSQFGVDVGSNDREFWVYSKVNLPNQKPAIFHAEHEKFRYASSSVKKAIPLEPVWLLEGLGLVQFESTDKHVGPVMTPEGFLRLTSIRQTPTGLKYRDTLIHAKHGTVLQQALYDQNKQLIAYTDSLDYKYFAQQQAALPEKIEMHLFGSGQHSKMVIEASDYQFNSLFGDPNQMWAMPRPNGVQAIDLTRLR